MNRRFYSAPLAVLTLLIAACGGGGGATEAEEVVIQPVGNEIRYAQTEFTVQAGSQVKLVFENVATIPAMQHNVVILRSSDAIDRVGMAAVQAGAAADYIPDDEAILAHTPLAQPEQTVEVTFTAPSEPGDYPYICTFPGHYTLMQGVMHVVEG